MKQEKSRHTICALSLFCSSILFASQVLAATYYVERYGSGGAACSKSDPCRTISDALDMAGSNDKILVGPGTYREALVIDENQTGLKLESTAGTYVTAIRTDSDTDVTLVGTPAIEILADKVSIGKKGGKGFYIRSRNAPGIKAGNIPEPGDTCIETSPGSSEWELNTDYSTNVDVTKTRIESNRIRTYLDLPALDNVPGDNLIECDDMGNVVDNSAPYLPSVWIQGQDATILSNVIQGEGTVVLDLKGMLGKVLVQDNIIRYEANSIDFNVSPEGGIAAFSDKTTIKGNHIIDWRTLDYFALSGTGVQVWGSNNKAKISNNQIDGFSWGISSDSTGSVDKNVLRWIGWIGIASVQDKKVADNTVVWDGTESPSRSGIEVTNMQKGKLSGNTVSSIFGTGINIINGDPDPDNGIYESGSISSVSSNNVYNLHFDPDFDNGCGFLILDSTYPIKMSKNFYGDPTNPLVEPEVLESSEPDGYLGPENSGRGSALCAGNGLVSGGTITNVTTKPTNKLNKIKAIIKEIVY